jgi:hypothetical protein
VGRARPRRRGPYETPGHHLSLTLLLATGCAAPPWETARHALQNPAYPGDANTDLAPYQARNRDLSACAWMDNWATLRTAATYGASPDEFEPKYLDVILAAWSRGAGRRGAMTTRRHP